MMSARAFACACTCNPNRPDVGRGEVGAYGLLWESAFGSTAFSMDMIIVVTWTRSAIGTSMPQGSSGVSAPQERLVRLQGAAW